MSVPSLSLRAPGADAWVAGAAVLAWSATVAAASRGADLWRGLGGTVIVLGAVVAILRWKELGPLLRPRLSPAVKGVAIGILLALATHAGYGVLVDLVPGFAVTTARLYQRVDVGSSLAHALLIVPIAAAEEIVWRGAVQGALQNRMSPGPALFIAAALYGLAHAPLGAPLAVAAFAAGVIWGALRAMTHGLVASFVTHLVWDEILLFVFPLAASGAGGR